jgi:hypothetical protein
MSLATWKRTSAVLAAGLGFYLCAVAAMIGLLGFSRLWYGFFDSTDIEVYYRYAMALDVGRRPFVDFPAEYPSLVLRLFDLPGHPADLAGYEKWFAFVMLVAMGAAAAFTSMAAARLWPRHRDALVSAGVFALSVLALGAIVANRFDAAVALCIAVSLWAVSSRRFATAGVALGLGAALKLMPVVLLPLPLLLARRRSDRAQTVVAFCIAALTPFIVDGIVAWDGLVSVFRYHGARPVQIESVLATPLLLANLAGLVDLGTGNAFGSQVLIGTGLSALAPLSAVLATVSFGAVVVIAKKARQRGMNEQQWVALCCTALLLSVMVPSKVLSPQYLVWLVPCVAVLAPGSYGVAAVLFGALLLTGIEFPALYWDFVKRDAGPVLLVAARNLALVVAFAWSVVLLATSRAVAKSP